LPSDEGVAVLFFPCNQFCDEEPGSAADIAAFYVDQHGLPASSLMERGDVNGDETQDVYKFLRSAQLPNQTDAEPIEWNYSKFIVGRDGQVVGRYNQQVGVPYLEEQIRSVL
jgi:glutathione peroxidase